MKPNAAAILAVAIIAFSLTAGGSAQQSSPPNRGDNTKAAQTNDPDVDSVRAGIRAKRKQIVAANLPLTDAEAAKFWPVYDRYIGDTIKVNDVRFALIKEYAQNYSNMTDDQADSFIKRWVSLDSDNTQLRLQYIPEFEKVISNKKTAMFFQVDRRVGMMLELEIAGQVPLVNP